MIISIAIICLLLLILLLLLLIRISRQLGKINKFNTIQLAYQCNPEVMLRATNVDSILRTAFKSSQEQIEPSKRSRAFLKLIENIVEI